MKFKDFHTLLMAIIICCLPIFALAQPDPGGDPDVPIDGGLSILLAVGVAYTAKKGYDNRKKKRLQHIQETIE
jgi:hypothetical protein